MKLEDVKSKLENVLKDSVLSHGLFEFLGKYGHYGLVGSYRLNDATRKANLAAIGRTFEYLCGEAGFVADGDLLTFQNSNVLKAANALKSITQLAQQDKHKYSLAITPGEKILRASDYPYDSFQMDLIYMFDVVGEATRQGEKVTLDFTKSAERNPQGFTNFQQIFSSLQKGIGVGSPTK